MNTCAFTIGEETKDAEFLLYGFGIGRAVSEQTARPCSQVFALRLPAAEGQALRVTVRLFMSDARLSIDLAAGGAPVATLGASANGWQDHRFEVPATAPRTDDWVKLTGRVSEDPHHPPAIEHPADLDTIDETFGPLIEIYSTWGNSEHYGAPLQPTTTNLPGCYVRDALGRGRRLGFMGGGDVHNTLPGDGGLTAVLAEELTLEGIYSAMADRRCYATSGDRILVDFWLNGFPMGSVLEVNQYTINKLFPISIACSAVCPHPFKLVEVISNGEVVCASDWVECRTEINLHLAFDKLQAPSRQAGHPRTHQSNISRYYYVRVTQQDGAIAWSSPIWIDYRYAWDGADRGGAAAIGARP
jgi:hypothetical protein